MMARVSEVGVSSPTAIGRGATRRRGAPLPTSQACKLPVQQSHEMVWLRRRANTCQAATPWT